MEIKFIDPEKQELYEKLFNTYWRHFKDNYDEYCEIFEKIKLQDIQTLSPEETIVGKIYSSKSFKFVDEGFSFENINIPKLDENLALYKVVDDVPIMKGINRESIKEYSQKIKQTFQNSKDQELYESLYKLYCKKHKINPKPNSVYSNAIYYRSFEHISKRSKHFNMHELVKSDGFYMSNILKGLGFDPPKKVDNSSKHFPAFDVQYPFWSIPDFTLRIATWFGVYELLASLFDLKAPVWYFLTFLISQVLFIGVISMLFKTDKLK